MLLNAPNHPPAKSKSEPSSLVTDTVAASPTARYSPPVYLARIEVDGDPSEALGGGALYPGMPAEVTILTGEPTLLGILFDPLPRSVRRAFRET